MDRFFKYVDKTTDCWDWIGDKHYKGYGKFYYKGRGRFAHRVSYELFVGPIPNGLTLDHICRNRGCVNPDHLQPVTVKENVLRGEGPTARNARKTHCHRGHPLIDGNLRVDKLPERHCKKCNVIFVMRYKARKKEEGALSPGD